MKEEDIIFEWSHTESSDKKRSTDWYWALGIIAIAGSIAAFLFSNHLFGVFILLSVTVLIFLSTQNSKEQNYKITEVGIIAGDEFFSFEKLKSFWLSDENQDFRLFLHTTKKINPVITLRFSDEEEGDEIHNALENFLEEKYLREPLSHQIFERLGF